MSLVYDFIGGPPVRTAGDGHGGLSIIIPARSCFSFYRISAALTFGPRYRCLVQGLPQPSNSTTHNWNRTTLLCCTTNPASAPRFPTPGNIERYLHARCYEYVSHRYPIERRSDGPEWVVSALLRCEQTNKKMPQTRPAPIGGQLYGSHYAVEN